MSFFHHIINWEKDIINNRNNKRNNKVWIFGEWWRKRCCDNSMYLANYIADNDDSIICVWITEKETDVSGLSKKITVSYIGDLETDKYIREAGVAIVNQNLQDFHKDFDFRCSGALIVNLWHGVAWKRIGLDSVRNNQPLKRIYQSFVLKLQKFDLFLCPAKIYEEIYIRTFCLMNSEKLMKCGQPRNSLFYANDKIELIKKHVKNTLKISEKSRIILYMPTFRDSGVKSFSFYDLKNADLEKWLKDNDIYIVQKAHFAERQTNSDRENNIITENSISSQELLASADMLITDYSSCFFDYLILDRPIIHYLYDYNYYANDDRGLYFDKSEVICGQVIESPDDLYDAIVENINNPLLYQELRRERLNTFMEYESPDSCEIIRKRICELIDKKEKERK